MIKRAGGSVLFLLCPQFYREKYQSETFNYSIIYSSFRLSPPVCLLQSGQNHRPDNAGTTGPGEQKQWEAAFYGGTFTALPPHLIKALLKPASEAMREGRITAIRISTRPDAIDEQILQILLDGGVRTVELGVQSMDQEVLAFSSWWDFPEKMVHLCAGQPVGESDCIRTLSEFIRCLCWKGQRWQIHGDRGNTVPAHWNQLCAPAHS